MHIVDSATHPNAQHRLDPHFRQCDAHAGRGARRRQQRGAVSDSDESRWVTGLQFKVDAGVTIN
jgi:hypothetical protein